VVPIPHLLAAVLREYLDKVRPNLPKSAYLFANSRGYRRFRGRCGSRALQDGERGRDLGKCGRSALPHRWRHSYATSLVRRDEELGRRCTARQVTGGGPPPHFNNIGDTLAFRPWSTYPLVWCCIACVKDRT
jgi:integrase